MTMSFGKADYDVLNFCIRFLMHVSSYPRNVLIPRNLRHVYTQVVPGSRRCEDIIHSYPVSVVPVLRILPDEEQINQFMRGLLQSNITKGS